MQHRFFALISRMRYIGRWGLMRNTFEENIQEHSHMVAVLAHGLAVIQRDILGQPADPDRCASAALFHDASEILTGDLFASVLAGGVARGVPLFQAAQAAADFVRDCIARTLAEGLTEQDGVDFEPLLGQLTSSK